MSLLRQSSVASTQAAKSPESRRARPSPQPPKLKSKFTKAEAGASDDELHRPSPDPADFMKFIEEGPAKPPVALTDVWLHQAEATITAAPLATSALPTPVTPETATLETVALPRKPRGQACHDPAPGLGTRSRGCRHGDERLVRPVARIEPCGRLDVSRVGVAADLVALVMRPCGPALARPSPRDGARRMAVWTMTFVFAVTAGIGFASTNISEVTLARASRMTQAIEAAHASLADARPRGIAMQRRRRQVLPRTRSGGGRTPACCRYSDAVGGADRRSANRGRHQAGRLALPWPAQTGAR